MKVRVICAFFLFAAASTPAFAGQNWVDQFLNRYRPSTQALPPTTQNTLPGLIRGGQIPLSISDLINLTLENNLDIAVTRLGPLSSRYLTETFYRPFEPTIRLSAGITRDTSPSRSQLTGASSVSQLTHDYTIGFGQSLQTGTDVAVDFTLNRTSSNNAFNTFNPAWVGLMNFSLTQHVLRNFGRSINNHEIRVAQNNKTISEIQFERQVIDMVTQAQKAYWDLVFTSEDLKVKQRSLDLAQKTLSDNRIQVDIGTLASIDLVQAELQVATSQEDLIVSNFTQTQVEDQVKKLLSPEPDPGLVLARVAPTNAARLPGDADILPVADAIKVALENRPEVREINLNLKNRDIDIEFARNQLLPSLDFTANFTQNSLGGVETLRDGFGPGAPIIRVTPGGPGDALRQLFGYNFTGYSVGVNLEIPLRNRAQQAEYARVVTEKKTAENQVKAIEQQIALEVRNAITQVQLQKARIEAAQKSRELAERQLGAEQKKFDLGTSTVRFVLEEQRNVTQMQTNEIAALINYTKALVDYDRALGMTLKKNNIEIDKTLVAAK